MGPAVTSEALSCERGERLRDTASLSPLNTLSGAVPLTGMTSTDEPISTIECHNNNPCSSSQPIETSAEVLTPNSNGQTVACPRLNLSKVPDGKLFSGTRTTHNVNLKDIQGCQRLSIFLKTNPCTMLPNGGVNCPSAPDEQKMVQVPARDETVPCGTVPPPIRLAKLADPCHAEDDVAPGRNKTRNTMMPRSRTADCAAGNPLQLELDSFPNGGVPADDSTLEVVSQIASDETESLRSLGSLDEMLSRQKMFDSRASRLLKRLRRLQSREVNSAVKEKLGQLASSLGQAAGEKASSTSKTQKAATKDALGNRELTALSTAELVSYVQKMQSSRQPSYSHRQAVGLGSLPTDDDCDAAVLSDRTQPSIGKTAGQLLSNMRHLRSALDSDATESSSGGDSGDEERPSLSSSSSSRDGVSNVPASVLTHKQLVSNWARERSGIISRWTWLQAQVSDLEYRIRQQGDIYKQFRLSKGSLSLRDPSTWTGQSTDGDLNGRIKSTKLVENQKNSCSVQSEGENSRFCVKLLPRTRQSNVTELLLENGIRTSESNVISGGKPVLPVSPPMSGTSPSTATRQQTTMHSGTATPSAPSAQTSAYDPTCRAARCLELRGWRRRTLLRTAGLHEVSRKASQLSTVRCTCYPPVTPCALCGGRYDRVTRPGPLVSTRDRLVLLDPSYHSVLSFPLDVPLALHAAESLWSGPIRDDHFTKYSFRPVSVRVKGRANGRSAAREFQQEQDEDSASDQRRFGSRVHSTAFHGRRSSLHTMETMRKKKRLTMNRKHLSKTSLRSSSFKGNRLQMLRRGYLTDAALKRRAGRSTFDINNVVIPSHVTSAARFDFIQYKEIVTPKWRRISKDVDSAATGGNSTDSRRASKSAKRPRLSMTCESDGAKKVHWSCEELDPSRHFSESGDTCGNETEAEDEIENLSDEAYAARHLRYEIYEKKQCMPVNVGHQRPSRSNRSESDSYTLLNPQSPDPGNLDASASLTSSTLSGGPSTSCHGYSDAEDAGHHHLGCEVGGVVLARQQDETRPAKGFPSWSPALPASHGSEPSSSEEPPRDGPAPAPASWPPRSFPLGNSENDHLLTGRSSEKSAADHQSTAVRSTSPAASTSTDSTDPVEEDPNDPEWTVTSRNKDKPGILIKFAKV